MQWKRRAGSLLPECPQNAQIFVQKDELCWKILEETRVKRLPAEKIYIIIKCT
jgi:hypothetical protein